MKDVCFDNLFYIDNSSLLVTALRTITSKFILEETIYPFDEIFLKPQKNYDKLLEFKKDKNGDVLLLEHPKNLKIVVYEAQNKIKPWDRYTWYTWIHDLTDAMFLYPPIKKLLNVYISELNSVFEKSIYDLDYLIHQTNGQLKPEMIKSYMLLYYELSTEHEVEWKKMLSGHIESMNYIFNQIINPVKKDQICFEIIETVKVLSKNLEITVHDPSLLHKTINNFKKEVHRILNHYTFYIDTEKINFKLWFLSLSQFLLHVKPVTFDLKKAIVKLNMVFFLATDIDELQNSHKVKYTWNDETKIKTVKENQLQTLCNIHPFIRNIHHGEIFHSNNA